MDQDGTQLNIVEISVITALLIGLEISLSIFLYGIGFGAVIDPAALDSLIMTLPTGVVLASLMHYKKLSYRKLFHSSSTSILNTFLVLTVPILLVIYGSNIIISDFANIVIWLFPLSPAAVASFPDLYSNGFPSIAMVCIVAPVIEELLFRGIFVRNFLQMYSLKRTLIYSALIFAIAHMNVYQLPVAFMMGLFLGWLYARTRSLWPCILAHIAFNSVSTTLFFVDDQASKILPDGRLPMHSPIEQVVAMTVAGIGMLALTWLFQRQAHRTTVADDDTDSR